MLVPARGAIKTSRLTLLALAAAAIVTALLPCGNAAAQDPVRGTGLPLPRFVSLKSDDVNIRRGPGGDHEVAWIYRKEGLPVEIIAEWDNWRKIRDADGEQGWVWHSLLTGKRDVLVEPWGKPRGTLPLYAGPAKTDRVVALLQRNVLGKVSRCNGTWCRIWSPRFDGWMRQDQLWGVYPGEKID